MDILTFLPRTMPQKFGDKADIPQEFQQFQQNPDYKVTYVSTMMIDEDFMRAKHSIHKDDCRETQRTLKNVDSAISLSSILVNHIDELASMYSKEWLKEADDTFRTVLMSFLSESTVMEVLGKKRCRDCLYYFEKPFVKPSKTRVASLGTFLSFFTRSKVSIGDDTFTWKHLDSSTTSTPTIIELAHQDNGHWVRKKWPSIKKYDYVIIRGERQENGWPPYRTSGKLASPC